MTKKQLIFIVCLSYVQQIIPITLVYNLRIRRSFDIPTSLKLGDGRSRILASVVPIFNARTSNIVDESLYRNICEVRRAGGSLFNVRYIPSKKWWLEGTTALLHDNARFTGTECFEASKTDIDDIVFAGGYRFFIGEHTQMVPYGIVGFPTTRKVTLEDRLGPLVGTRFYNAGFGLETSYSFIKELKQTLSLVLQQRFIHGFNRSWFPILPCDATIQPGNFTDLLGTIQYRRKFSVFEGGYNATLFTNQAIIFPDRKAETNTIVRHGGYISALHLIRKAAFDKPTAFGGGLNFSSTNALDARVVTVWLNISIVF